MQQKGKTSKDFKTKFWYIKFDKANINLEKNSDLDSDAEVYLKEAMMSKIIDDESGVTSSNYLKKRPIRISIVGALNAASLLWLNY